MISESIVFSSKNMFIDFSRRLKDKIESFGQVEQSPEPSPPKIGKNYHCIKYFIQNQFERQKYEISRYIQGDS